MNEDDVSGRGTGRGGPGLTDRASPPGRPGASRPLGDGILRIWTALVVAFVLLAAWAGYWQVIEAESLSTAADNPAVVAAERRVVRGVIRDRDGRILATSKRDANGEPYRVYSDASLGPVLGYASRQFGTAGLERAYDAELTGLRRPDPVSDMLRKFDPNPYDPQDLTLSLSLALQKAAVRELGAGRGAVVMLDPRTGEVLALASTPTYDASRVADPETAAKAFAKLLDDPSQPLLDRATTGLYVPGSVFKIVTAIAGLGTGAIEPTTTYAEQPKAERTGLLVSGFRVRDGHHPFTGSKPLDLAGAIEVSCNIYFALSGLRIGGEALVDRAGRLGFGSPIPFDLPTAASQLTNGGGDFGGGFADDVELANAAYGQAEVLVSPLQMALVAAAVANNGILMKPRLVTALTGRQSGTRRIAAEVWRDVIDAEQALVLRQAMQQAVEGDLGRIFTAGAKVPGIPTAGKSGTAQLGGKAEPHSWFIGFAPADDPRVAIAVVVEQSGFDRRASPIAGRLLRAYFAAAGQ